MCRIIFLTFTGSFKVAYLMMNGLIVISYKLQVSDASNTYRSFLFSICVIIPDFWGLCLFGIKIGIATALTS